MKNAEYLVSTVAESMGTAESAELEEEAFVFPMSFAQQRLWFLDQLERDSAFYNIPAAVRITGPLEVSVLERSLNEIVRRHEALRTTFATVQGEPVQLIAPHAEVRLPVRDLTALGEQAREQEVQRLVREEARCPFDLSRGPLLRVSVLKLAEHCHVLLLNMHHIISDGWSIGVFFQELAAFYGAFSWGEAAPLPPLPVQYADYALWQRQWLQGEVLQTQLAYWRERLKGDLPVLELLSDRPRLAVQTYRGALKAFALPRELSQALNDLARRQGVTLFMVLLAAFQVLLHRYTQQKDILVGSPIAGRNRSEIEGLIGFFVNTLVLRTDLTGDPTFVELLSRVKEVTLGA